MANTSVIVIPEGKICDYVDGKFRNDTPEEYVRQTIEKRLVNEHKYLPKQIRIEYTLQLGSRKPRADIVIFDKDCGERTQENIKIIIECKKEAVEARNAKDGVEQLKSYMSACPNCEWGMWTNGRQKEVYHELDPSNKKYLSLSQHGERIEKQLELHENMTLITCSGTIGKVALVGRHWEKWAANQHIIRIVPASENIAGYLNIFLASEYGYHLITRYRGSAVCFIC